MSIEAQAAVIRVGEGGCRPLDWKVWPMTGSRRATGAVKS